MVNAVASPSFTRMWHTALVLMLIIKDPGAHLIVITKTDGNIAVSQ